MHGSHAAQPLGAEGGEDVALGLVDVAAVGAGAQLEALGGQPVAGEVGTEAERADLVVAAVALSGQPGSERFGLGPVGAGRMPASAFLAGDGVEPFVDDRLVAATLAGDMSLHGGSS
jgi:hypothetical protein